MKNNLATAFILLTLSCSSQRQHYTLQIAAEPADLERLAAKEICRYVRLCNGETMTVAAGDMYYLPDRFKEHDELAAMKV